MKTKIIAQLLLILSAAMGLCSCGGDDEPEEWAIEERWKSLSFLEQQELIRERVLKLARMRIGETEPFSVSDAELELLEKRQVDLCRRCSVAERAEDRKKALPVLSDEAPQELSSEEQTRLTHLFTSLWNDEPPPLSPEEQEEMTRFFITYFWKDKAHPPSAEIQALLTTFLTNLYMCCSNTNGKTLFGGIPAKLGKDELFILKSLGFSVDLEGIAQIMQTKPETRSGVDKILLRHWQLSCLPANVPDLTAQLYWWNKDGTRCLLYLLPHQASIYMEPAPGKIEAYHYWDYPYYRDKKFSDAELAE